MPSSTTCHSLQNLKDASLRISNTTPAYSIGIHRPIGLFAFPCTVKMACKNTQLAVKARAQPQYLTYLIPSPFHYLFSSFLPTPRYEPPLLPCQNPKPWRKNRGGGGGGCRNIIRCAFFAARSAHQELRFWYSKEVI